MTNETKTKKQRKILIGDKDERILGSLRRMASMYFDKIDVSSNPNEVIEMARNQYDVIITDLEYSPGKQEGYSVLHAVREFAPIRILFTGREGESDVQSIAKSYGATHVIGKDNSGLCKLTCLLDSERRK